MMLYKIRIPKPHTHFIEIEYIIRNVNSPFLEIQLPAWRPGRYELGNFAKNIRTWEAKDGKGNILPSGKITKDRWEVTTGGVSEVHVHYDYYAARLDAGSCWLDESQLYVNPVHCCLYVPDRTAEPCTVELELPSGYEIACSMKKKGKHVLLAENYDELVDSPFIASHSLKKKTYSVAGTDFHLWFQGEFKPDWEKIVSDFEKFTAEQVTMMGDCPFGEYHFLFQIVPRKFYHGVEHLSSTVIALGPSYDVLKKIMYEDFTGISSHELFHAWNIKTIRPAEMMPYDYTKENYFRTGFVAEGITTYYGDLLLFRSGVYSEFEYFKNFHKQLQRHFDNYGRFNMPVSAASFDTWLDGYGQSIPDRSTNIYTEGCLLAFIADMMIRKNSGNRHSLDDVMRLLYLDFGKKGKGYTEQDYKDAVEKYAGKETASLFQRYYYGTEDFEPALSDALDYVGLEIIKSRSRLYFENRFGFKAVNNPSGSVRISFVAPGSVADKAGMAPDDEITSINGIKLQSNLKEWCKYFAEEETQFTLFKNQEYKSLSLMPGEERYYQVHYPYKKKNPSEVQKENFRLWNKHKF